MRLSGILVNMSFLLLVLVALTNSIPSDAREQEGLRILAKAIGAALALGLAGIGAGIAV